MIYFRREVAVSRRKCSYSNLGLHIKASQVTFAVVSDCHTQHYQQHIILSRWCAAAIDRAEAEPKTMTIVLYGGGKSRC